MRSVTCLFLLISCAGFAQQNPIGKFEQLAQQLPTPNQYRTGSGAPGVSYWQQATDYDIAVTLDEETHQVTGEETVTYHNHAPSTLRYLWLQLDQNKLAHGSLSITSTTSHLRDSVPVKSVSDALGGYGYGYQGGYRITHVQDVAGNTLPYVINHTMMRIDLPEPLKTGASYSFFIAWNYTEYNREKFKERGGYEYFPDDGNSIYTCAQWYPRMCVYDDYEGWQNKQFLGNGEFALTFGNYTVRITVPNDYIVGATGWLQNPQETLSKKQLERFKKAQKTFDKPVLIVTEDEARKNEKTRSKKKNTWVFHADQVRDFAFACSRKFIWDAMAVKIADKTVLAQSLYPKEGNPLWEEKSTLAICNTLALYSSRTIPYPYPTAFSVHTADQGMEYPMISFNWGRPRPDGFYSQRTLEKMITVIIHEVGHNFFPMIVNSDERQWTWMDEGLNTFLERETLRTYYPTFDISSGSPKGIVPFMQGDKSIMRPIMTMSDNQGDSFESNGYTKPAAALTLLRETIMGNTLFDYAFKEYALRWQFKHPKPADFFRTMEDASGIDLDWFWRGWFYSTDPVDITLKNINWFTVSLPKNKPEKQIINVKKQYLGKKEYLGNFDKNPSPLPLIPISKKEYGEFLEMLNENDIRKKLVGKHIYEVTFVNKGGLVSPLIIEWTYRDRSTEIERLPAELWRRNDKEVTKLFVKEKEVIRVLIDPHFETADVNPRDNVLPRKKSLFFNRPQP